ncbi:MAG TPA: zinc-dependent metalloprotease [Actinomycetota bacterium]|nr:zinc-dependent metalloprotease [Actinomycetota bacterium]
MEHRGDEGADEAPRPFEVPMGDVFADVPLFREIQRVLLSSRGPVNWELARQVGMATAQWGREDPAPGPDEQRAFEEAVRLAELHVAGATGLEPPSDLPVVRAVRRAEWVRANVEGLREVLEPAAERIGGAVGAVGRELAGGQAGQDLASQVLAQLSPLLLGAQVGTVLGMLGQQVLGQYDVALPRSRPAELLFVAPNVRAFERDWSLPPEELRAWVALHEVTHRFEFGRPWVPVRFRALLDDFLSTLRFDAEALRERLERLDPADPASLQELLGSGEGLGGVVLDDEQRLKLGRIQAFMAAAEGYGDHVTRTVARQILPSHPRIEEAVRRREAEPGDPLFERLLGIEVKREQYRLGAAFCDRVAELAGEPVLARMWGEPDALPSLPELEEPRLWLARVG